MFIQKLFSPKWKHKNPNIRKEALQALNPGKEDSQKIFAEVAKIDSDISIRRMVVGRLRDIGLLRILQQTQDPLADSAGKRIRQLIAGTAPYSIDYVSRKRALEQTSDQETWEYIAREAKEAELRLMAVEKIDRQALLGDLAVDDEDQDVRLTALEKIKQLSTLERVFKNSRLKDKRISALAKERLDALTAEQERPKVLKKQARQCCADLESLVQRCTKSGAWLSAKPRFDSLQSTWREVKAQWQVEFGEWDKALFAKFNEFSGQFEERHRLKLEEDAQKRALEEKAEPFKAQKRKLCEELEKQLEQITALKSASAQQLQDLQTSLEQSAKSWESAQQALSNELSTSTEHEDIDHRYYRLSNELNGYKKDLQAYLEYQNKLNQLAEKTQALISQQDSIDPPAVTALQQKHTKLVKPKHFQVDESLQSQVVQNLQALSQRLEEQEKQRLAHIEEFTELVGKLSNALQAGNTKHAVNLSNRGKKLLGLISQRDRHVLQKNKLINQFNTCIKQLNELQSWRQWSNAPVKEQLCQRMQQLAHQVTENQDNPEFDFQDAAQRVKDARAEWKKITTAEPGSSNGLWEAFDAACTQAYEPCQRFFDQQAQLRGDNLQRREAACASLEQYLEVLSHKPTDLIDWKALDKIVRVAQQEWQTLGAVERGERAAINKRFRNVINGLRKLHLDQKNRNKEEKELLIKRVEAVVEQLEGEKIALSDAIDTIKRLQADWKEVGLAAGDGELWKRFRAGCDKVFERREQETAAIRQERQEIIDSRAAVCEAIENLAKLEGDALKAAQKDFEDLKQQWSELPALQKPSPNGAKKHSKQEPLEKRFREACRMFDEQNRQRIENERRRIVQIQQQQAQLCRQGESILFHCLQQQTPLEQGLQAWDEIQAQWRQLPEYSHAVSKALQQRFDNIDALLQHASESGVEPVAQEVKQQESVRLNEKQLLCLQMEVLANIDSPPEARQARMEYQVSQLADKMKQSAANNITSDIEALQVQWHLSGVVDPVSHESLERRFEQAYQALNSST